MIFDPEFEEQIKPILNIRDYCGHTPLHLAAKKWPKVPQKTVKYLLEAGANFGTFDKSGESCISKINPQTFKEYLNTKCVGDEDVVIFDYR